MLLVDVRLGSGFGVGDMGKGWRDIELGLVWYLMRSRYRILAAV